VYGLRRARHPIAELGRLAADAEEVRRLAATIGAYLEEREPAPH
jgi:hypothetical protein